MLSTPLRRPAAILAVIVMAALTASACSSVTAGPATVTSQGGGPATGAAVGATPGGGTTPGGTGAVPTTSSIACPAQVSARKGVIDDSVVSNGEKRTYRLWVPTTYTGTTPLPIIVNYHGTDGNPQSVDDFSSNLSQKANARNYLVVAPQAEVGGSTSIRWTVPGFGTVPDDVAMTNAMIDKIATEFCVNAKRVYATGFSSGGAMTTWIACSDSSRFAAAVPGGGVNLIDPSCQKGPIPMFAYHGTKDQFAFFNGIGNNPTKPNPATAATLPFFGSVELNMTYWAKGNGCQPNFTDYKIAPDATLRVWPGCTASTQLLLALGGGHTFPGGTTRLDGTLGATIQDVNMADEMLNWLDTQSKL